MFCGGKADARVGETDSNLLVSKMPKPTQEVDADP